LKTFSAVTASPLIFIVRLNFLQHRFSFLCLIQSAGFRDEGIYILSVKHRRLPSAKNIGLEASFDRRGVEGIGN
jgi:hypothetical protein